MKTLVASLLPIFLSTAAQAHIATHPHTHEPDGWALTALGVLALFALAGLAIRVTRV